MTKSNHLICRKSVELALLWCSLKYGHSIWGVSPIRLNISTKLNCYGRYEPTGIIRINPSLHKSMIEMINTVIHEYIHHKQPILIEYTYPRFKETGYTVDTHPFELEARKIANRDARVCRNWVLSRLK